MVYGANLWAICDESEIVNKWIDDIRYSRVLHIKYLLPLVSTVL